MTPEKAVPESPDQAEDAAGLLRPTKPEIAPSVEKSLPPAFPTNCRTTLQREKNWWNRLKPFVEIGGLVLLSVYTWYTIKIYCANHATLLQIQQQTLLMQRQVEAVTAAIVTDQFTITWPKKAYLTIVLDNRGKIVGSDIHADFRLEKISVSDGRVMNSPLQKNWEFTIPEISPNPALPEMRSLTLDVPQQDFRDHPMERAIKLTGKLTYFNGFRQVPQSVCYYIFSPIDYKNKLGVVQQTNGASVIKCDELTNLVANYQQLKQDIGAR